jgi:hypothetical protein
LFTEQTEFVRATFSGPVEFSEVEFEHSVDFTASVFCGLANFSRASFPARASFEAIRSEVSFSVADAKFSGVPNFVDATFCEAPRLDNVKVAQCDWHRGDREMIAYYRKLRAMAIAGHDHEREREFFVNELRARRGHLDRPWSGRYLVGLLYGILSDYGRNMGRPAALWLFSFCLGWAWYYWQHLKAAGEKLPTFGSFASRDFLRSECIAGKGLAILKAGFLSLKYSLVIVPWDKSEQLAGSAACLFGVVDMDGHSIPNFTDSVLIVSFAQAGLSVVILFLLALTIRNYLRLG